MKYITLSLIVIVAVVGVTGCTPIVQPRVSSSEFLVEGDKIPGDIELFISEEFRSHTAEKTDISEFKTWKFELGTVAADTFRFSLESRFEHVSVRLGAPKFKMDSDENFYAVVQPEFTNFEASDPILFKFEDYKAKVGFLVTVYNAKEQKILSQTYTGQGVKQGSIGYDDPGHSAYPIAVQEAIKDAVSKFVNDLVNLAKTSTRPSDK